MKKYYFLYFDKKKLYLEGIPSSVEAAAAAGEAASLIDAVADRILADN